MNDNPLNEEMFAWKQHPFTQRFFKFMFWCRERNKEDWAQGQFEGADLDQMTLKQAKTLGGVAALSELLSIEMQDIIDGEKEANEYIRNQGRWLDSAR